MGELLGNIHSNWDLGSTLYVLPVLSSWLHKIGDVDASIDNLDSSSSSYPYHYAYPWQFATGGSLTNC